ncbi:hypothetical protein ABIC65_001467 [Sphingomonas trueperi]|uniref:hypothetical protein n=1 Tax=Sphingomonas trueperi TaxID=53317 RepID=UPI003394EFFF
MFPIEQIEPGFGDLVPICRELPLLFGGGRSGALDNVYVTPTGGIVLIEAKLWRNPQARREVVAQAMEYAGAVFRMGYEAFEQAVRKARRASSEAEVSIYELVRACDPGVGEAEFIEAVSRNLSRGRAVVAVVGDGIRDDIAPLAELLQSHAGQRFTFALVELGVFAAPDGGSRVIVPSVLAKTVLIERGVVRLDDSALRVDAVQMERASTLAATARRGVSIGEDEFYELLGQRDPEAPALLRAFLEKLDPLGFYVDLKGSLNLRHDGAGGRPLNLGSIRKDGFVNTSPASWFGRYPEARAYNERLARAIQGKVGEDKAGAECALRTGADKTPRLRDLLPLHEATWLEAIEKYVQNVVTRESISLP